MHFIPHYCIIVDNAKYFFEIYLSICSEVPDQSRGSKKKKKDILVNTLLKFISNTLILGNGQTTSLTVHICALVQGRRKGKELDASVFKKKAD